MEGVAGEAERSLLLAREGDAEALGRVLQACHGYLLLIAREALDRGLQAKGGASDLVQETFLDAQRDLRQFQGTTEAELLAWLRRLLLNNLADFARRYRGTEKRNVGREVGLETDSSSVDRQRVCLISDRTTPSRQLIAGEVTAALQQAMSRLPNDYRRVLLLRYQQELSFEEIGRILDCTGNAARKLWTRAVRRLQHEMEGAP